MFASVPEKMVHRSNSIHSIESVVESSHEAPAFFIQKSTATATGSEPNVLTSPPIIKTTAAEATADQEKQQDDDKSNDSTTSSSCSNSSSSSDDSSSSISSTSSGNESDLPLKERVSSEKASQQQHQPDETVKRLSNNNSHQKDATNKSDVDVDDDNEKNDSKTMTTTTTTTVRCSLPLYRLTDTYRDSLTTTTTTTTTMQPKKTNNISMPSSIVVSADVAAIAPTIKTMCLYCDRTFASQKLTDKHSLRTHHAPEGRRLSKRQSTAATVTQLHRYPGCSHCSHGKTTTLLPAEELPALFHHLIEFHFDAYFACKTCEIRFASADALQTHVIEEHGGGGGGGQKQRRPITKELERITTTANEDESTVVAPTDQVRVKINKMLNKKTPPLRSSRRQQQQAKLLASLKPTAPTLRKKQMLRNEETILTRLGLAQNRSPRTRRGGGLLKTLTSPIGGGASQQLQVCFLSIHQLLYRQQNRTFHATLKL